MATKVFVLWNDVKKGDIVRDQYKHLNKVMDNKRGVIRMVQAPNGDIGSMYIYNFTAVLVQDGDRHVWLPTAVTTLQANQLRNIASAMMDDGAHRIINIMEQYYADAMEYIEAKKR